MKILRRFAGLLIACALTVAAFAQQGSITSHTPRGPLVLSTYTHTAGAFCSLTLGGFEFIDAKDHGRCLQSAASFDWQGEAFNPTEAGASMFTDGLLPAASSSQVLNYVIGPSTIATEVRMAYWNPVAGQRTSDYVHRKWVQAGLASNPNAIEYRVAFEVPAHAHHGIGQFEILTGYMPPIFTRFQTLNPINGALAPISDGPGEQPLPLIFSTANGAYAIGVLSPTPLTFGGYGRWRFGDTVKWNVVTRINSPRGTQRFRVLLVTGTEREVASGMLAIQRAEAAAAAERGAR